MRIEIKVSDVWNSPLGMKNEGDAEKAKTPGSESVSKDLSKKLPNFTAGISIFQAWYKNNWFHKGSLSPSDDHNKECGSSDTMLQTVY